MTVSWLRRTHLDGALDRVWPAVAALAAVTVLTTSRVPLNLWLVDGSPAAALAVAYAALTAALVVVPSSLTLHRIVFILAVLFWGGRAGGFLRLVVHEGRGDLWGAVAERAAMATSVATLHLIAARRIGVSQALQSRGLLRDG